MKRLIILILLMAVLVACGSTKEADKEVKEDSNVAETEVAEEEVKEEPKEESKEEPKEEPKPKEDTIKEEEKPATDNKKPEKEPVEKPAEKPVEKPAEEPKEKPEKAPVVKNEKVEVAAENIIWAQNDRNYSVLKSYLGQNITLNEKNNTLKITNVDYPQDAELLKGIKKEDLEHRFTHDNGKDHIVGFAAIDHDRDMSYTIDLTMRVGKDSWKMLNMQINK